MADQSDSELLHSPEALTEQPMAADPLDASETLTFSNIPDDKPQTTSEMMNTPKTEPPKHPEDNDNKLTPRSISTRLPTSNKRSDKIHNDLAKVHKDTLPQQASKIQPVTNQGSGHRPAKINSARTYQLIPQPSNVPFRILDPIYIKWQSFPHSLSIKTPRRFVAKPNEPYHSRHVQSQSTKAIDYSSYLLIPGFCMIQNTGIKFASHRH